MADSSNFKKMTKWNDFPSMEDTQSRKKCSLRGLLPRSQTYNLCSSTMEGRFIDVNRLPMEMATRLRRFMHQQAHASLHFTSPRPIMGSRRPLHTRDMLRTAARDMWAGGRAAS